MNNINENNKRLKMYRPDETMPPHVSLDVTIPIGFGSRSETVAEYKNELLNVLEIKQGQVFQLMGYLGSLIAADDTWRTDLLGEYLVLLGEIGEGFSNASSMVRETFEGDNSEWIEMEQAKRLRKETSNAK